MSYYQTQYVNIKGDRGERGPQGVQGPPGYDGQPGPRGEVGPEGPIGPRGFEGPRGLQGIIGNDGPKGQKGDMGNFGPQGPQGPNGSLGTTGTTGPYGSTGIRGNVGLRGEKGDSLNIQWVGDLLRSNGNLKYTNISGETIKGLYIVNNDLSNKLDNIKNSNNDTIVVLNTNDLSIDLFNSYITKNINAGLQPNEKHFEEKVFYVGNTSTNILSNDSKSHKIDASGTNLLDENNVNSSKNHLISITYDNSNNVFKPYLMNQAGNDIINRLNQLETENNNIKQKFNNLIDKLKAGTAITDADKIV